MQENAGTAAKKQRSRRQRMRRMFPDRRSTQRAGPDRRHGPGRRKSDKAGASS